MPDEEFYEDLATGFELEYQRSHEEKEKQSADEQTIMMDES